MPVRYARGNILIVLPELNQQPGKAIISICFCLSWGGCTIGVREVFHRPQELLYAQDLCRVIA